MFVWNVHAKSSQKKKQTCFVSFIGYSTRPDTLEKCDYFDISLKMTQTDLNCSTARYSVCVVSRKSVSYICWFYWFQRGIAFKKNENHLRGCDGLVSQTQKSMLTSLSNAISIIL